MGKMWSRERTEKINKTQHHGYGQMKRRRHCVGGWAARLVP